VPRGLAALMPTHPVDALPKAASFAPPTVVVLAGLGMWSSVNWRARATELGPEHSTHRNKDRTSLTH
jgi:hypothetical protein